MASIKQEQLFRESIMPSDLLDQSIEWISSNFGPEDVFTTADLKRWAQGQGIGEVFDEKEIIGQAQAIGLEDVFPASAMEEWASKNGYVKE